MVPQPGILQSVVQKVAVRLKVDLDALEQVENDFRVSKAKVAMGRLPHDSPDNRAAVLLQSHHRIPWNKVSKAVGVTAAKLKKLQNTVRNYLLSAPADTTSGGSSRTVHTASQQRLRRTSTNRGHPYIPQHVSVICFRLAGFLPDPGQTEQKARQLLTLIYAHQPSDVEERRVHWYDLQRYAAALEAAAVYCIAHQQTNSSSSHGTAVVLTLDELVEASHAATTLLEVQQMVPRVKQLMTLLEWGKPQQPPSLSSSSSQQTTRKRKATQQQQKNVVAHIHGAPNSANESSKSSEPAPTTTPAVVATRTDEEMFHEWQDHMFQTAIERHGTWAAAAEHAFQRHGLSERSGMSSTPATPQQTAEQPEGSAAVAE